MGYVPFPGHWLSRYPHLRRSDDQTSTILGYTTQPSERFTVAHNTSSRNEYENTDPTYSLSHNFGTFRMISKGSICASTEKEMITCFEREGGTTLYRSC